MHLIEGLEDLFTYYIKNLYAAEKQIAAAMPAIVEKAQHQSLKNALQHHLTISKKHCSRLQKIIALLNENTSDTAGENEQETNIHESAVSSGIAGLINEANDLLHQDINKTVNDAAIIGCVQKIEHYEICTYGTALAYAMQLHLHKTAELLRETLDEEYDVDDLLTALATAALNKEGIPEGWDVDSIKSSENEEAGSTGVPENAHTGAIITERTILSPGGRAGLSHRRYPSGESRGH
ncbi:DUF892 family protein [Ilyomonas limi]|uniref:DUF892 family protein n=1 Tax=Ilyomonas limi TaxID=2575867 RepID=A0A4V5UWK8_9BACT|nr:DUF892 family protein [Ilyomonas limi]TKK71703.1 DUF892 family protein [Ilyomonas limi]